MATKKLIKINEQIYNALCKYDCEKGGNIEKVSIAVREIVDGLPKGNIVAEFLDKWLCVPYDDEVQHYCDLVNYWRGIYAAIRL